MSSISVLGIFVADLVFFGKDIPSKGQTILGNDYKIGPGGKGSNQAITVAKLGGNVDFITKIGKDSYGEMALSIYKETNVKTDSILVDNNHPTGAGDVFNGALAYSLANDTNIKDAIIFANKVAGISTTRLGAANSVPTLNEFDNYQI